MRSRYLRLFAPFLIFFLLVAGLITYIFTRPSTPLPVLPLPNFGRTPSPRPLNQQFTQKYLPGTIVGTLNYPGPTLPADLQVCAQEVSTYQTYCTTDHLNSVTGNRYQLSVPQGSYLVYALVPEHPDIKAFYSQYVVCGLASECVSHQPVPVNVFAGQTVSDIDPVVAIAFFSIAFSRSLDTTFIFRNLRGEDI